jgi:hypothetical protein
VNLNEIGDQFAVTRYVGQSYSILATLGDMDPMIEMETGPDICRFCNSVWSLDQPPARPVPMHEIDCVWIRACQIIGLGIDPHRTYDDPIRTDLERD